MADFTPESMAGFISESVADFPRNQQPAPYCRVCAERIAAIAAAVAVQGIGVDRYSTRHDGRALEVARASLAQLVNDYCGTPPRHPPIPGIRFPPPKSEPGPADLIAAALTLYQARRMWADQTLAGAFQDAGERLAAHALGPS